MKLGVLGKGTVGKAVFEGLQFLGHQMSYYDPKDTDTNLHDVIDTECVFICVPTPQLDNNECDVSIVESVVKYLAQQNYQGLVAIKSTVIPGTTDRMQELYPNLKICAVPEFLRAKTALADFVYHHDLLLIGTHNQQDVELLQQIHGNFPQNVVRVTPVEAEITKYFNNVHNALQVTFANITYDLCQQLGADYNAVYNAAIKRSCINPQYLICNENMRGYGGHCLPKDTAAWNNLIKQQGLDYKLIQAVIDDNNRVGK